MNVSNFLNSKTEDDIPSFRSFLYKNYIKTVIEGVPDIEDEYRIMFIGNRFKSDFNNPISFECNGIIYTYNKIEKKFKAVVIPTQLFNSQKLSKGEINNFLLHKKYKIHKIYDGTILNLYFYKNEWRISSNKAYDCTKLMFFNNKTYGDVFNEVLIQYPEFNINKLNTNKCYSICLKHHGYHPFIENKFTPSDKIIFIQSVDVNHFNNTGKIVITKENIGLPVSEEYELKEGECLNNLINNLHREIESFKSNSHLVNYQPNFGLILRSCDHNTTKSYSNILLESNLMAKIRNLIYNYNLKKKLNFYDKLSNSKTIEIDKCYYDLKKICLLKVFLNGQDINLFLTLFPQYKEDFQKYNRFLVHITKYILKNDLIIQKNLDNISKIMKNDMTVELSKIPSEFDYNSYKIDKLVFLLIVEFNNKHINLNANQKYDIVLDFLHNDSFIDYYYSCLYK